GPLARQRCGETTLLPPLQQRGACDGPPLVPEVVAGDLPNRGVTDDVPRMNDQAVSVTGLVPGICSRQQVAQDRQRRIVGAHVDLPAVRGASSARERSARA